MVPFSITLSDLARHRAASPRQLNIYGISATLTRKLLSVIDDIIVDVFKIICCSEPTDSFMVKVIVAQLPGHSRGTRFYTHSTCLGCPPPLAPPQSRALSWNSATPTYSNYSLQMSRNKQTNIYLLIKP